MWPWLRADSSIRVAQCVSCSWARRQGGAVVHLSLTTSVKLRPFDPVLAHREINLMLPLLLFLGSCLSLSPLGLLPSSTSCRPLCSFRPRILSVFFYPHCIRFKLKSWAILGFIQKESTVWIGSLLDLVEVSFFCGRFSMRRGTEISCLLWQCYLWTKCIFSSYIPAVRAGGNALQLWTLHALWFLRFFFSESYLMCSFLAWRNGSLEHPTRTSSQGATKTSRTARPAGPDSAADRPSTKSPPAGRSPKVERRMTMSAEREVSDLNAKPLLFSTLLLSSSISK